MSQHTDKEDTQRSKSIRKKERVIRSILPAVWPRKEEFDSIGSNSAVLRQYTSYAAARLSACDARDIERLAEWVIKRLHLLPAHLEWELHLVLGLLSTRLGTLLLIGPKCLTKRPPFVTAFWDLPLRRIESILLHWLASRFPIFRKLGRGLKGLCHQAIFSCPALMLPGQGIAYGSAALQSIGYNGRPPPKPLSPAAQGEEDAVRGCMLALAGSGPHVRGSISQVAQNLQARGFQAAHVEKGTPSDATSDRTWLPPPVAAAAEAVVECDVLVVGAGCGGGVAAAVLAAAGLKVLVVEKGPYVDPEALPRADDEAFSSIFENGATLATIDSGCLIMAGTGVGGGSRINWGASFRTPPHVRHEWAERHGAAFVDTPRFTRALDTICSRLGVHNEPECTRDRSATALKAGANALGSHFDMIPQNCATPAACEKHCSHGCAAGGKRDTARAFLAPAASSGNIAILCHTGAERVLTTACGDAAGGRRRRACGAVLHMETNESGATSEARGGRVGGRARVCVAVKARAVVSAAGSLHTPALLLRSAVHGRGNVGRHLRLHPATFVIAEMPPSIKSEQRTLADAMNAPMMSVYSRAAARWPPVGAPAERGGAFDTDAAEGGYGAFVSVTATAPGLLLPLLPFRDRFQALQNILAVPNMVTVICYTRDQGPCGRVVLNSEGQPKVTYRASRATQRAMGEAVDFMLRSMHAAGAMRILTAHDAYLEFAQDVSRSILFDTARVPSLDSQRTSGRGSADSGPGSRRVSEAEQQGGGRRGSGGGAPPQRVSDTGSRTGSAPLSETLPRSRSATSSPFPPMAAAGERDADAFDAWRGKVRRRGFSPMRLPYASAHQMGSARMGSDPKTSAVDVQGQSWDVEGLWVCDASVFPTATGVNPMVTIEALALCISENIAGSLLGTEFEFEQGQLPESPCQFEW